MNAPVITRPALRYLGGKFRLARWIIQHLPPHRIYVEPFGGAASVLLRKPRAYSEVYNDLEDEVVNLFRVLREAASAARLVELVALTPFARSEFDLAYARSPDPVERARRTLVRAFMGHGNIAARIDRRTGFRRNVTRAYSTPATDWANYPPALAEIGERLMGVVIEQRPALEVIEHFDGPEALFYVDPPYVHSARGEPRTYRGTAYPSAGYIHELNDDDHGRLLEMLSGLKAMVVLSGYPHPLYDFWLDGGGWRRVEKATHADGARPRIECLWLNPAAVAALDSGGGD